MIAPSLLAADFGNLQRDIEMINKSDADYLHLDVMDGNFVPNITLGIPVIEVAHKYSNKPLDIHLMLHDPHKYISKFAKRGASLLSVHYEVCDNLHRTLQKIKEFNMQAGIVLNPHSPVYLLEDIIIDADLVLLMSVNPGYGGQPFIENTYSKISDLKELILRRNSKALIQVDGGVTEENAAKLYQTGVDILVAGTTIFKAEDPIAKVSELKNKKAQ